MMDDDLCSTMSTSMISSSDCVVGGGGVVGGSIGNSSCGSISASSSCSSNSSNNNLGANCGSGSSSTEQFIICCKVCGTMSGLRRCSRCKSVYYCSQVHQQVDWRVHKIECKKFDAISKSSEYHLKNRPCDLM